MGTLLGTLGSDSPCLPKFTAGQDYIKHSFRIRLLVARLERMKALPTARCGHVHIRQMLPARCEAPAVRVPQAPLLRLRPASFSAFRSHLSARWRVMGAAELSGDGNRGAPPIPGLAWIIRSKAALTIGIVGTVVSLFCWSVSARPGLRLASCASLSRLPNRGPYRNQKTLFLVVVDLCPYS